MRHGLVLSAAFALLSACNPGATPSTPASSSPGATGNGSVQAGASSTAGAANPASAASGSSTSGSTASGSSSTAVSVNGSVSGDIYASKANYLAFLDCAASKYPGAKPFASNLRYTLTRSDYTDARWREDKAGLETQYKFMVEQYSAGCIGTASGTTQAGAGATGSTSAGSGTTASESPTSSGSAAVSGDIFASKANYLTFLSCAGKKDATAAQMSGILTTAVNIYTDEMWPTIKGVIQVSHKAFIDQYGAGCK